MGKRIWIAVCAMILVWCCGSGGSGKDSLAAILGVLGIAFVWHEWERNPDAENRG